MEYQYLNLISQILNNGCEKPSRTGNNTLSITGPQMRFKLTNDAGESILPLITTKFTSFKLIATELLWILSGDTNAGTLAAQGNHIWDANGSREALDKNGFVLREEGELGPIYGHQWRNWNAKSPLTNGIDQIKKVINDISTDPYSRRHIVSAWNPEQLPDMALPPCHMIFQFIVRPPGILDCVLFQRSADVPLGVPFNIASYSLLTHMIAAICDLKPGEFIHNIGDAHIYSNQIPGCLEQIERTPYDFPTINLPKKHIDYYEYSDFKLENYNHHPSIKFPFSV